MAAAEYILPWQVRLAKKIRREADNWKDAFRILFPRKIEPKPDLEILPQNVIQLPPLADRIKEFAEQEKRQNGQVPTCRQVAEAMNCHPSTVSRALRR